MQVDLEVLTIFPGVEMTGPASGQTIHDLPRQLLAGHEILHAVHDVFGSGTERVEEYCASRRRRTDIVENPEALRRRAL